MANTLYHNPRCSKSRQAKQLLEEKGISFEVREYLKSPLSAGEIQSLLSQLGLPAHNLLRTKEAEYKEHQLSKDSSESDIVAAIAQSPKLLERPVLVTDKGARIGRPTEALLEIL
ncbi:arsenate reductase (glutaredoxin) [Reinekea blandensis]|uniref:Arsenate reductase n=1 Tax=Reinekea blandensis MED297 TaxID=314283 RepID=A4BFF4_9GAMM|nr:arsenate reductase (glutaredoxin) [Reinekea blandensis]EAR09049.1 arsenate reductase [Reinekea sp. MED297] [Reinekea blandensis MED297]